MAFATDIRSNDASIASRVRNLRAEFWAWRARRAAFRQTYDELAALSDRDLNDLGIYRADIARIADDASRQTI